MGVRRIYRLEMVMGNAWGYIVALLSFVLGILAVIVMVVFFMQRNEIDTLRRDLARQTQELASCSDVKQDCIGQLGCFYRDPMEVLRNNKKGQKNVSR